MCSLPSKRKYVPPFFVIEKETWRSWEAQKTGRGTPEKSHGGRRSEKRSREATFGESLRAFTFDSSLWRSRLAATRPDRVSAPVWDGASTIPTKTQRLRIKCLLHWCLNRRHSCSPNNCLNLCSMICRPRVISSPLLRKLHLVGRLRLLLTFWGAFREIFRKRVIFGKTSTNYISPKR